MTCEISPTRRLTWTCSLQHLQSRRCRAASASARFCLAPPAISTSPDTLVPVPTPYPSTNSFRFHTYEKQGEGGGVQAHDSLFRSLLHSLPSAATHLLISQSLPHFYPEPPGWEGRLRKTPGVWGLSIPNAPAGYPNESQYGTSHVHSPTFNVRPSASLPPTFPRVILASHQQRSLFHEAV